MAHRMAHEEGLLVGISSGAATWAAVAGGLPPRERRQARRGHHPVLRRALPQHRPVRGPRRLSMLESLRRDVAAVRERDPAARSDAEVVLCYPGLHAVWGHRVAHRLWRADHQLVARFVSGGRGPGRRVDIHPAATIGSGLFIDHAIGVVIGETAVVGDDVTIYQGVTLGGTSLEAGQAPSDGGGPGHHRGRSQGARSGDRRVREPDRGQRRGGARRPARLGGGRRARSGHRPQQAAERHGGHRPRRRPPARPGRGDPRGAAAPGRRARARGRRSGPDPRDPPVGVRACGRARTSRSEVRCRPA